MENTEQIQEKRDIGYRIGNISVAAYNSDIDSVDFDQLSGFQTYPFNVRMSFAVTKDLLGIAIRADVAMKINPEDETPAIRIATDTVLQLTNLEDYMVEDSKVFIPEPLLGVWISIALSTTRGILMAKNFGTPFQRVIMPLFDLQSLVPKNPLTITEAILTNPLPATEL